MKSLLFIALALSCATVDAQVYKCPQFHPDKDHSDAPLTGARIMWGEKHGNGWLAGVDSTPVKGGLDSHYDFGDRGWLVCVYDFRKRSERKRPEDAEWWIQLDSKLSQCNLRVRDAKPGNTGKSTASVTALCK
jgi:hypothetical protein